MDTTRAPTRSQILVAVGAIVCLLMAMLTMVTSSAASAASTPTITTDAADYPPGATVTVTGTGWQAGEVVHVFVNDDASNSWSLGSEPDPVADYAGAFTYQFNLPSWFAANYSVTATGPISGVATATFTDLSIGTYDQCSNDLGSGYPTGDTGCRWINGNLQKNNSAYVEGDATVQRVWLTDLVPGSTHTVTFTYGTTKGGHHAYDYLTTWNWSENWITEADRCQGIAGCETASAESKLNMSNDPNVTDTIEPPASPARQFVMRGGTITNASVPTIVSGAYTGDSETAVTVSFTVGASSGAMCSTKNGVTTCGVALWFGAHVAMTAQWQPFNGTSGAGGISGSPYHVALSALDGASVGQRDNQMQSETIVPNGTIVIVKDALPNDPQDFSFNLTNGTTLNTNFLLDDDSDPALQNTKTFSVPPGTYTASELSIPSGWRLTNLVCVDPTSNTTVDTATGVATINLASLETVTCTYTDTKGSDLTVAKTAVPSFTRTYKWLIDKSVDQTQINVAEGGTATFNYSVKVTPDGYTDSASSVSGVITLTNSNPFDITGVNVTDAVPGGVCSVTNGTNVTVPANGSATRNYSCTFASKPSTTVTDTATATWSSVLTPSGSASGTADATFGTPTTEVDKVITVVDDKTDQLNPVTLGTSDYYTGPYTFTYSLDKQGVAGTCTDYTNTAVIDETDQSDTQTVKVCVGKDLTVTKVAAGTFDRTYLWQITKDVDKTSVSIAEGGSYTFNYTVGVEQTGVSDSGWTLGGTITVTNPNDWEDITLTGVTDTVDNGGTCTVGPGPYTVAAGKSIDIAYSCSYASQPSYAGTNSATVTWDKGAAFTPTGSATGSVSFTQSQLGSTNKTVHVTDTYGGALGTVTATDSAPFAQATFTYSRTESGVAGTCTTYDNTATITETGQSASQSVELCVGKDLTVTKTAAGTFDRSYNWLIDKSVDDTRIEIADGGTATFHYTVTVTPNGFVDSGWTLSGTITVTNPNDWEAITAEVTDAYDGGGVCTVTGGNDVVVPAGQSVTLDYSCTFDTQPAYSGKNTATATWDKALYSTPSGTASGDDAVTLGLKGETNRTVTVVDDKTTGAPVTLGTSDYYAGPYTFTYSLDKQGVAGTCTDYTNTAVIDETKQSDTQTVTVCVGMDLTVTKIAAGSYFRSWAWEISKTADATYDLFAGGTVTHQYNVTVTPTYTDSQWLVKGTITVANPNDWEAITATVTDAVDNGGTCVVEDGVGVSIPAAGSKAFDYTCTYAAPPISYSGLNTATVTWDKALFFTPSGSATGSASFQLTNAGEADPVITVDDDNLIGESWTAGRAEATWIYPYDFSCPTDPSLYIGGTYSYTHTNTATINETGQNDTATVTVNCHAPVVTKDVTTYFNRDWDWKITKVDDGSYDLFAGGSAIHGYKVTVTPTFTDNFWGAKGFITITNNHPTQDMVLSSISDVAGGINGAVSCPSLTVPKAGSLTCTYDTGAQTSPNANPFGDTNTATAVFAGANWTGTAPIAFSPNPTTENEPTITVDDSNLTGETWTADRSAKSWEYSKDFSCSTEQGAYENGAYSYSDTNTATIIETKQSDTATVDVTCHAPVVTKTADTYFNRDWDWTITKVDDGSYDLFAGDTVTHAYKVTVDPAYTDNFWGVKGTITIANNHPTEAMTLSSVQDLAGGFDGTVVCLSLVVPANGTLVCTYDTGGQDFPDDNPFGVNNEAWATFAGVDWSGFAPIIFSSTPTTEDQPVITVDDDNLTGENWSANRASGEWTYSKDFSCSTNPADYTGGTYSYGLTNTAEITETHQTDTATVDVRCYAPVVTKTAAGTYDERHEWTVEKSVTPTSQNELAGGTAGFEWTVTVTESVFEENFAATGEVSITNLNPKAAMVVGLSDVLSDATQATITGCTIGTWDGTSRTVSIPAGATAVCTYSAGPSGRTATLNTATVNLNGLTTTATADLGWTANIIRGSASLDDDQNPGLPVTITEGGTWKYGDAYTCSTDPDDYTNGTYTHSESNTAVVTSGDKSDDATASTSVACYAPVVTKTAETYFNRDWDWTITKDYDGSYDLFAGDTVTHGYKVAVDPTSTDSGWGVKGTITVTNPDPTQDMVLTSVTDLAGGIDGKATCPSLTVPKGGTLTCTYDTGPQASPDKNPFGDTNTATAVFTGANWIGSAPIVFSSTPTTEDQPIVTVDDSNLTGENWSADRAPGEWTYSAGLSCPTDPSSYKDGKYSYSHTNTATINETDQWDTATVDVTCYWPQVELTKTGDSLSKIGDPVTYTITLENNTPTTRGLRDLSCSISDPAIGFNKLVTLSSGASDTSTKTINVPSGASDPFVNTASVTCQPVAATAPVVGDSTFSVSDSSTWSTNLFQPAVEIVKTGPATASVGEAVTYTFTVNNKSSADTPNLVLDAISDNVIGDLKAAALAAGCDNLVAPDGTCTFTVTYTVTTPVNAPMGVQNTVKVDYHPTGFTNDIWDTDTHLLLIVPKSQLTDTSYCPLPNNQFRLLYHLEAAPNVYRLQASNPGQFYFNAFYNGTPGSDFTMTVQVPYPFMTQEGAGNPIQVHDGTGMTSSGCYSPYPSLSGFTITTPAMTPTSSAGNQIITPEDYSSKTMGTPTAVTVSGKVPATGLVYVTIHLDYGLKKTGSWKATGTFTTNPVSGNSIPDVNNGTVAIHGYEEYTFSRTVGGSTDTVTPSSYNEIKKFAGFLGFVSNQATEDLIANARVVIYDPTNRVLTTVYTDEDGYYMYEYKHKAKAATYTVKLPNYGKSTAVTVKANGFAAVSFET